MESIITAEPTGKEAGRVTIMSTLNSLIPPVAISLIVISCFLVGIIGAEVAGVAILTALGLGGITTGTVYKTAKNTPTDQVRTETVIKEVEVPVAAPTAGHDVDIMLGDTGGAHAAPATATTLRAELEARGL